MTLLRHTTIALAVGGLLLGSAAPAVAQTPPDLRDLVGARAGQAENALRMRGYEWVSTDTGSVTKWAYWRRGDDCVQISTSDGRYQAIERADRGRCKIGGGSSDAGKAVVATALVLGLAAALAEHNKKDHDRHDNHDDEYERGYQAGLYGAPYGRDDSEAYHDGYIAGETERNNRSYSTSGSVYAAPRAARDACSRRADEFQSRPYGSSVPISVRSLGRGDFEMTMATGPYRSRCVVSSTGSIRSIDPY